MEKLEKKQEIIKILFTDFTEHYNSRNISKKISISHAGAYKILKNLEKRQIVIPKKIGKAIIYTLNFNDSAAKKELELSLVIDSLKYKRWIDEFRELNQYSHFIILFGSIMRNEKEAKDIDILIVSGEKSHKSISRIIQNRQQFLNKPIHPIIQSKEDFLKDVRSKNKAIVEIIKSGAVIFGQENFVEMLQNTK